MKTEKVQAPGEAQLVSPVEPMTGRNPRRIAKKSMASRNRRHIAKKVVGGHKKRVGGNRRRLTR